jgi:hypothetical protein
MVLLARPRAPLMLRRSHPMRPALSEGVAHVHQVPPFVRPVGSGAPVSTLRRVKDLVRNALGRGLACHHRAA